MILALIGQIGTTGAVGHAIEYTGEDVRALSMEARLTLCNMSIEAGSRTGLVAPDETTFDYLEGRARTPRDTVWEQAVAEWRGLISDTDAVFDREVTIDLTTLAPQVSFGTSPDQVLPIDGPDPADCTEDAGRAKLQRALDYMALTPGTAMTDIAIDHVFIGSCTNGPIEDLRAAAHIVGGRHVAPGVTRLHAAARDGAPFTIDLNAQELRLPQTGVWAFEADPARREALPLGIDEIARIHTRFSPAIAVFEAEQRRSAPCLWSNDIG